MENGRQVVGSRTNDTLNLAPDDFTEKGTYTLGRFLGAECRAKHWRENCTALAVDNSGPRKYMKPREANDWLCPSLVKLGEACQSDMSKRFFRLWVQSQGGFYFEDAEGQGLSRANRVERGLISAYNFPALIPEVWLNYLGPRKTADDESHLEENPSRVDFVIFAEGKKCVIEIDGPSHYADYDEAHRTYVVSEKRYTKNLRIERSLRRQGWEIFRFSNHEVQTTPDENFLSLIGDLPGVNEIPF
jgi:hypothetical protein